MAELEAERTHEADGRIENIFELAGVAAEYEDLSEFLETVALVADSDELDSDGTRVNLMTMHTAKGLEFQAVFLTGLEEGIFPHMRTLAEPLELEEERRLCYVGVTRAKRAALPVARLAPHPVGHDLPQHPVALSVRGARRAGRTTSGWSARAGRGSDCPRPPGAARPPGPRPSASQPATRVVHDRWGEGTVLSAKGEGDGAQAEVRFGSVGSKKLLLSAAPLRRA